MYELLIKRSAERDLRKLPKSVFRRVNKRILALPDDSYPAGVRKLDSLLAGWRIRIGDYRVVYQIDEEAQVLTIIRVRHRRDVYR